jgi:lipopolysaccharide transport system permease protein
MVEGMESSVSMLDAETEKADGVPPALAPTKPTLVIEPKRGLLAFDLKAIWEYRELLFFIVWRDVKIRYKQTAIGVSWVVLQPLLTMIMFSAIFGKLAKIPSDGTPYPIFVYAALLPWNLFASSLARSGDSVVGSANLVAKIYFPRLILPLAGAIAPLLDFAVAFGMLIGMSLWFGILPGWAILSLPFFIALTVATAFAVALFLAALNVRYRDVGHAIPFLVQLWMFASPVAYPVSLIPARWRFFYGLNPMAGVIEGFRWALLGQTRPDFTVIGVSTLMVVILLLPGLIYFRYTERTFADVI